MANYMRSVYPAEQWEAAIAEIIDGSPTTVTEEYDAISTDRSILADASDGAFAVNLEEVTNASTFELMIMKIGSDTNQISVTPANGEEIAGLGADIVFPLIADGSYVKLIPDKTNDVWRITGQG